jgi:hypothetical protein
MWRVSSFVFSFVLGLSAIAAGQGRMDLAGHARRLDSLPSPAFS